MVGEGDFVHIDAEVMVERGEDFAEGDGAVCGLRADLVGGADDLAVAHVAASEHGAGDAGPVVAPAFGIDDGGAAKFPPDDDGDVLLHAALVQVCDEGAEGAIEEGQVFAELLEIVAVIIPAAEAERDDACSGFD